MSIDRNPYKNHPEAEIWTAKSKEFYPRDFVSEVIKEFNKQFGQFNEFEYIGSFLTQCDVSDNIKEILYTIQKEGIINDSSISSILSIDNDWEESWIKINNNSKLLVNILIDRQELIRTQNLSISEQLELH